MALYDQFLGGDESVPNVPESFIQAAFIAFLTGAQSRAQAEAAMQIAPNDPDFNEIINLFNGINPTTKGSPGLNQLAKDTARWLFAQAMFTVATSAERKFLGITTRAEVQQRIQDYATALNAFTFDDL